MPLRRLLPAFLTVVTFWSAPPVEALEVTPGEREFTLSTATLSALVRDGAIVELRDRRSGKLWAERSEKAANLPTGLGVLHDLDQFRRGHIPWGEPTLKQHLEPDFALTNYLRPNAESAYQLEHNAQRVVVTWRGLSNGQRFHPEATLTLTFGETEQGALTCQITGEMPEGGLFGASYPLANLTPQAEVIVPGFGGISYLATDSPAALMPFGSSPFLEAQLLLAQEGNHALALWMQDATMRNLYAFVRRHPEEGFALALESHNLMPFEAQKKIATPTFYLQVFEGGWQQAATPYRDWYQSEFAKEIAVRDSIPWANAVTGILDIYMQVPTAEVLEKIATFFPKKNLLFQIWNARAPAFDTELPDWTPREGYIEGVKRIHDAGLKAKAYVNTYCANYLSPVWKRDKLSDFFLTKKNSPWHYKGRSLADTDGALHEKLIGTVDYSEGGDPFADIPEGRLLYGDPLSARWRTYHAEMMKTWNSTTGTDANYEDTAGVVSDSGNGVIDGLSAGQGSVAQIRLLQQTQPHVPMSSEYGPAGIAFGTKWALNYASHWGYDDFKRYRLSRQYPLTAYLYGYRQWMPAIGAGSPLLTHTLVAASDATGGFGFAPSDAFLRRSLEELLADTSWHGHLLLRTKLFSEEELQPHFPKDPYPPEHRAFYRGISGIFTYSDQGGLQQMIDPKGQPRYGRVHGTNRVATPLWLANWPFQNGKEIYGLDPRDHYPLFPRPEKSTPTTLELETPTDGIRLTHYSQGPGYVLMTLDALPGGPEEIDLPLKENTPLSSYYLNDQPAAKHRLSGKLPLQLVAFNPEQLEAPITTLPGREPHHVRKQTLYLHTGTNVHTHFPFEVPKGEHAFEFYFRNLQDRYPFHGFDGTIVRFLINGKEVRSFDCLPGSGPDRKPDTHLRRWIIPTHAYQGQRVLVTIVTDAKAQPIQDRQFIGIPKLIPHPGKEIEERVFDGSYQSLQALHGSGEEIGTVRAGGVHFEGKPLTIDPKRNYRLAGKFRASDAASSGSVSFGFAPFDAEGKPIQPAQVNPVEGSLTTLAKEAEAGATEIELTDAKGWKKGEHLLLAFDLSDEGLPHRQLVAIDAIEDNRVTLKTPLPHALEAGSAVRQHQSGNTFIYSAAAFRPLPQNKEWVEFSGEISGEALSGLPNDQWWPGTRSARIVILTSYPEIEFKEIVLDEIAF